MATLTSPRSVHDRFDLERLADELAEREAGPSSRAPAPAPLALDDDVADGLPAGTPALPVFRPLAHDDPYLSTTGFDVEAFLLSRAAHGTLPDVRAELRDYLAALKEELVRLINDDYEAFISLSTDLRDEGATLERLKSPLGELKERILVSRNELQVVQDNIQEKLRKRARLRDEKTFLHLLLKISESVSRLESLLLIAAPPESGLSTLDGHDTALSALATGDGFDERSRENRAKHLSRVAAEYTQLLYHVSKAQTQKSAFVDEMQWRVDRIKSTLTSDLDNLFATTVLALTDGGKDETKSARATEAEKARLTSDLLDCLRTYDILHLWRDAEDVLRRELVRVFAKNNIFAGALAGPQSPIVPRTPFLGGPPSQYSTNDWQPPRTPYTPFSAFAVKQNPFEVTFGAATTSAATPWLDDTDDPLAALYNKILRFVERDLKRIMDAAERVCVHSGTRARATVTAQAAPPTSGPLEKSLRREQAGAFDIMANVVWAEVGRAIMDELGSVVFAAGKPDEFRKHHETTQAFIRALEFLAPSVPAIEAMRAHSTYSAFDRRWQLPVYFQLRWKEIVTKLEVPLSITRLETAVKTDQAPFVTPQAAAVFAAISTCWSAEVYIPELAHRFWKFTLQLISRYKSWLEASLPPFELPPRVLNGTGPEKNVIQSPASPAPSTPLPGADGVESTAADPTYIRQFAAAIVDVRAMESRIKDLWQQEIGVMLPEGFQLHDGENVASPEDVLEASLLSLTKFVQPVSSHVVTLLSRQCCDAVAAVKSIPGQVRMSKRPPTEPSHFVPGILRPLKEFFGIQASDGPGEPLREEFLEAYSTDVFEAVCKRYAFYLASWKKMEESLRRHQRAQKTTFSLFGSGRQSKEDQNRDDERVRTQMVLDVDAFGNDAQSLGVHIRQVNAYISLLDIVNTTSTEDS